MARAKPNTVELLVHVRVPAGVSAELTRRVVANHWWGEIDLDLCEEDRLGVDALHPRFVRGARIIKRKGK